MKNYRETKTVMALAKFLKLPKGTAAKVAMRTSLVTAIRRAVEKKRLTHVEAAKKAGVGRTVITALLNGNTTHVSTDRLIDVAHNLSLTVTLKVA